MFRIILPTIFLLGIVLFVAVNLLGAGHGPNTFDFVVSCAYPTAFLTDLLERLVGGPDTLWFLLGILAGSAQYFFIGYFIDKLLQRSRRLKTKDSN